MASKKVRVPKIVTKLSSACTELNFTVDQLYRASGQVAGVTQKRIESDIGNYHLTTSTKGGEIDPPMYVRQYINTLRRGRARERTRLRVQKRAA